MTSVGPRCGETGAHVVLTGKVPLLRGDWGCWKHAEGLRDTYMFSCAFWLLHGCQGQFAGSGLMGGAYWPFSMQWGGGVREGSNIQGRTYTRIQREGEVPVIALVATCFFSVKPQ